MTIWEYDDKFTNLTQFTEAMIPNEFEKAKKFEGGFRPEIQSKVAILRLEKYNDVLDATLIIEDELLLRRCRHPISMAWKLSILYPDD